MRVRHNFGPENGPQHTAVSNQTSEGSQRPGEIKCLTGTGEQGNISQDFTSNNGGPGAPGEHLCPLDRNCRARCLALDAGDLPAALRWFNGNYKWHERGRMTNRVKLRLVFKKPIRSAVNTLLADRLDGLTAKIEEVFSKLQHNAETLDNLRIDDEDELVMPEHTMAYLDEGLGELAAMLESGVQNRE